MVEENTHIAVIERAIRAGQAYESYGFVFFDHAKIPCRFNPRTFDDLDRIAMHPLDYVVWIPDEIHGIDSPWGRGLPTVNVSRAQL